MELIEKERIIEREKRAEGVAGTGAFSKKSDFVYKGRVVIKNNYLKIADAKCPKWKPRRFYTKLSVNRKEEWKKNYYYTKKKRLLHRHFENNKYYQLLSSVELIPSWVLNTYYQKFTDSYADLVANGIKKFKGTFPIKIKFLRHFHRILSTILEILLELLRT